MAELMASIFVECRPSPSEKIYTVATHHLNCTAGCNRESSSQRSQYTLMSIYTLTAPLLHRKLNAKQRQTLLARSTATDLDPSQGLRHAIQTLWITACESVHSSLYSLNRTEGRRASATTTASQGLKFPRLGEFVVVRERSVNSIASTVGTNKGKIQLLLETRLLRNMTSKQSKRPTLERGQQRKPSSTLSYVALSQRCRVSKDIVVAVVDAVVQTFAESGSRGTRVVLPLGPLGAVVSNGRGTVVHRNAVKVYQEEEEEEGSRMGSSASSDTVKSSNDGGSSNGSTWSREEAKNGMFASGNGILKWGDSKDSRTERPAGRGGGQERQERPAHSTSATRNPNKARDSKRATTSGGVNRSRHSARPARTARTARTANNTRAVSGNRRASSMYELEGRKQTLEELVSLVAVFTSLDRVVSAHVGSGNNSGSRGLLNEKALVLGFHVTEEEARQLVQEGCGRGGSRTGSRGYLSVEDFVYVPIAVVYMYVW